MTHRGEASPTGTARPEHGAREGVDHSSWRCCHCEEAPRTQPRSNQQPSLRAVERPSDQMSNVPRFLNKITERHSLGVSGGRYLSPHLSLKLTLTPAA